MTDFDPWMHLLAGRASHLGALLLAAVIFIALTIMGRLLAGLLRRVAPRHPNHAALLGILARVVETAGIILGLLSALQNAGVDVTAFLASLGLAGLTLGFALRDVASSFVAGLLLILYKPFRPGERISVQGIEGHVTSIDMRYTVLRGEGGRRHLVPNSVILANPVTVIDTVAETSDN